MEPEQNPTEAIRYTAVVVGDIGNTYARFARVEECPGAQPSEPVPVSGGGLAPQFIRPARLLTGDLDAGRFRHIIAEMGVADALWRIASVHRGASQLLADWRWPPGDSSRIQLLTRRDFPLSVAVEQPDRVGVDRLAAALAAGRLKDSASSAVVVDAGTAVTIDAVAVDGTFLGGTISPGVAVSLQALAQHTSQLPRIQDVSAAGRRRVIGRNTEQAIANGVWWGCVGAVREIVDRTGRELGGPFEVFVTGGDGAMLAEQLPWPAQVFPDLVWRGLLP